MPDVQEGRQAGASGVVTKAVALPINIDDLIRHRRVESARIEYKKDWNPERVLHSVCAFANDIDNWGGGYVILGVEEKDGEPVLPPCGLRKQSVDAVCKELINVCNLIEARYIPIVSHEVYQEADILVIWCPASMVRPHKCPVTIAKDAKSEKAYYIRKATSTLRANLDEERQLIEYCGRVPFDDRPNMRASVDDLQHGLLIQYLHAVKSRLAQDAENRSVRELARDMHLLEGPPEDEHPLNVALMFFNSDPERFFRYARIEVVDKPDPTGSGMVEKTFTGPLDFQLTQALAYIKNRFVAERIDKISGQEKADRHWNYPYDAIEEALANAVYHKAYDIPEPIVVTVTPECMTIDSAPGIDRSISDENIRRLQLVTTRYRNRRIGEFLKELDLAEGRNTGMPAIIRACEGNGSPLPRFETDEDRRQLRVVLPIHPAFRADYKAPDGENNPFAVQKPSIGMGKPSIDIGNAQERTLKTTEKGISGTIQATTQETTEKTSEKGGLKSGLKSSLKSGLNKTDVIIVDGIESNAKSTIPDLMDLTGLSRNGVKKALDRLKSAGIIRRVGPDKGGHWEVVG